MALLPAANHLRIVVGVLTAASPDGTVTIEIGGHAVGVGAFASNRILVVV